MRPQIYRTFIVFIIATASANAQTLPANINKSEPLSPLPPTAEYLKKQSKSGENRGILRLEAGPLADFYELVAQHQPRKIIEANPASKSADIQEKTIAKREKEILAKQN